MSDRISKTHCVSADIRGFLALPDSEIAGVFVEDGRPLAAGETRAALELLLQQGFEVVPVCDNHDAKGDCLGHAYRHHELKTWPEAFGAAWKGDKLAEYRNDDRGFRPREYLELREFDPATGAYSGREITARITHIARGPHVPEGFAMLSFKVIEKRLSTRSES